MNKKLVQNNQGLVLVLLAVTLPVILFLMVIIIDGGRLYIRQSEIQHLANASANSGLVVLSNLLLAKSQNNYDDQCNIEEPPDICDNGNTFDFLDSAEITEIINEENTYMQILNNVSDFAKNHDYHIPPLNNANLQIIFPYNYTNGQNNVFIKVKISVLKNRIFDKFLNNNEISNQNIQVEAIAQLPLQ